MDTASLAHSAHETTNTIHERGTCAGCDTTTKALIAPRKNLRSYTGPMHCLSCSPRFSGGGLAMFERMGD